MQNVKEIITDEESVLFFPYDSRPNDITGEDDRVYNAQDWRDYFKQFIGNGVYKNPADGLKVLSEENTMVLTLKAGAGFIYGSFYMQKNDEKFVVDEADLTLKRKDIVVLRHDVITRSIMPQYIVGTPALSPQRPKLTRNDDIYDLLLSEISVAPGTTHIKNGDILDTRLDNEVCGIVSGLIDQVDTTAIFNQYYEYLQDQIELWEGIQSDKISEWEDVVEQIELDREKLLQTINYIESLAFQRIQKDFNAEEYRIGNTYKTEFTRNENKRLVIVKSEIYPTNGGDKVADRITDFVYTGNRLSEVNVETNISDYEFVDGDLTIIFPDFSYKTKTIFERDASKRITETKKEVI